MTAGEPLSDRAAADPATRDEETEWRRIRYAWLYDDEDIWASPAPTETARS